MQVEKQYNPPTLASQVRLPLVVGRVTRKARATMRRMYGAGGRRIERIIVEREVA